MQAGIIWVFDPKANVTSVFRSPSGMASGIKFDRRGRMVVAGGADYGMRSVIRTDMISGRSQIIAASYRGRPFNAPNDLVIDSAGRIYFTDPRYFGHESVEQPVFGVYRIDEDLSVHLILADVSKPNGIDISPDGKTLYVVEHDIRVLDRRIGTAAVRDMGEMRILAYDLADGAATNQRVFVDFGNEKGADGIAIDSLGNVYAAVMSGSRPGIRIYSPAGRQIAEVATPEWPSNCTLVPSALGSDLYITATTSLYRISTCIAPSPLYYPWADPEHGKGAI
jgi:gluconolactonase